MCGEFRVSKESHDGIPVTLQGSKQCLHPMRRRLCWMTKNANSWKPWLVPIRLHRRSPFEPELCCVRRTKMLRAICRLPWSSVAAETPSGSGEGGSRPKACLGCKMLRGPADRGAFPPSQHVDVVSIATSLPADYGCHATRWSLDDIASTILNQSHAEAMSRSTIWRILNEGDLKPHKIQYWLNSHDPDFEKKARDICTLYVDAPRLYQQGRLVICCDEKTGMQILERKHPTKPLICGIPERREHEYIRHGTRVLINSFAVATGRRCRNLRPAKWLGTSARRGPVKTSRRICVMPRHNFPTCNVMIGCWII